MCGINGFIKNIETTNAEKLLLNMNKAIRHRGPNDQGIFIDNFENKTIGFGQVRLSIVDLSPAGHQPMLYRNGEGRVENGESDLVIVFNGEIYNFQELKEQLIKLGYNFSTKCDTEIILAAYLEWGEDCVNKFNGFWAFAIYDKANSKLFCSRDRLGKKPFYYYFDGEQFIFSSELKGILEHKELNIATKENINPEALDFYFTTGFIPSPWTIYKNVKKLEARNNLELRMENGELKIKTYCYYEIPKYEPIYDKKSLIEEGKKLLEDSTKIRMFADVPVGAYLSGGLDSSSVVGEMTKFTDKEKLHTFSIGFSGKYDESKYINIVKDAFGTNHHHKYFNNEDFQMMMDEISFYYDEPFADYSNFPTTFVSRLAKQFVTVALSGDGGDEIFGGYMMHKVGAQMSFIYSIPEFIRKNLYKIVPATQNNLSLFSKIKEALRVSLLPKEKFYGNIGGSSVYKAPVYQKWTEEKFKEILDKCDGNFTQAMIDYDLFYNTLADNFLVKVDRASMSVALEVRSPFLDYRFIELARKIPVEYKVDIKKTKKIMRDIITGIVPNVIVNRGKQGFEPPIKDWVLDGKYINKISNGLEILHKEGIIDEKWYEFYKDKVMYQNNTLYNVYKVKLFLLIKWYEKWIGKIFN